MVNPIPYIHVAATLENVKIIEGFTPSEETKERISILGLNALLKEKDSSINLEVLEANVWKLEDFINSLNFLEVFSLYAAQANLGSQRNKKVLEGNIDKNVMKAVKEIEYINKLLESDPKKIGKTVLKQHTERLNYIINKIFTENLSQTEQIAIGKIVEKAEYILKKMSK
jgi:hypothetical protein